MPGSVFCADKFHLMKYINSAANQMSDKREIAKQEIYKLLYKRKKKKLLSYIDEMLNCADNPYPVEKLKTFISGNWDAIMRTLHNKTVCGCSAESHASHMLSDRLSSRPKGWSKTGADRISKLRCYAKNNGQEKIIDLVRYSREKRQLAQTGTDCITVKNVYMNGIINDHTDSSKKYIDVIQATMPGATSVKMFSIREQLKMI